VEEVGERKKTETRGVGREERRREMGDIQRGSGCGYPKCCNHLHVILANRQVALVETTPSLRKFLNDLRHAILSRIYRIGNETMVRCDVRLVLSSGYPINYIDANGQTTLLQALSLGAYTAVKLLVRRGADVNRGTCNTRATALSLALELRGPRA
jgi:ankyrin repeat protein